MRDTFCVILCGKAPQFAANPLHLLLPPSQVQVRYTARSCVRLYAAFSHSPPWPRCWAALGRRRTLRRTAGSMRSSTGGATPAAPRSACSGERWRRLATRRATAWTRAQSGAALAPSRGQLRARRLGASCPPGDGGPARYGFPHSSQCSLPHCPFFTAPAPHMTHFYGARSHAPPVYHCSAHQAPPSIIYVGTPASTSGADFEYLTHACAMQTGGGADRRLAEVAGRQCDSARFTDAAPPPRPRHAAA